MEDKEGQAPSGAERKPYIPKPPGRADLDQVSQEQGLITDEWAEPGAGEAATGPTPGTDSGATPSGATPDKTAP